ncbi:glycosyltransferase family 4 protein [Mangrovibacillus cuniculi]|uniref:Glycosyltransferase family 4 protein n=1 Tax=Mangrovibacillus cuniculi TaxID=2593652 RepID=A0A7S8HFG1_9BACI|nr:glycosyltransferase family 4 protein [Mangrovibacillus cuniculi]QPC46879.1 glycosyltransferase family 4 protein [Mangrovibacillus cuniculi]
MNKQVIALYSTIPLNENFGEITHLVVSPRELEELTKKENSSFTTLLQKVNNDGIQLIPTFDQQLPLTLIHYPEIITSMIKQLKSKWITLTGREITDCWLPNASYAAGIDKWLIQSGITKTYIPLPAIEIANDQEDTVYQVKTIRGLTLVGYKKQGDLYNVTLKEDNVPTLHIDMTYEGMYDGEVLINEKDLEAVRLWSHLEKSAYEFGMTQWMMERCNGAQITSNLLSEITEEMDSLVKSIQSLPLSNTSRMRVAILAWEYPPNCIGGLSTHVYHLAKNLVNENLQVTVFTPKRDGEPTLLMEEGVEVVRVDVLHEKDAHFLDWVGSMNIALAKAVNRSHQIKPFQLIHAHDWLVAESGKSISYKHDIPLITTIHSTEFGRNKGIHNEVQSFIYEQEKALMKSSQKVILCHHSLKEDLLDGYKGVVADSQLMIIPNGMEDEPVRPPSHHRLNVLFENRPMFSSLARFVPEKGLETVIRAIYELKMEGISTGAVIAGIGPLEKELTKLVNDLDLQNEIFFPGFVTEEERAVLLSHSKAVVIPSTYEPFGLVAVEAFSYGCPVIAANVGGLKGLILEGKTGFSFTSNNVKELVYKMKLVLNEPVKAQEIGLAGQKMAKSLFSWKQHANRTKACYEDCLTEYKVRETVR